MPFPSGVRTIRQGEALKGLACLMVAVAGE